MLKSIAAINLNVRLFHLLVILFVLAIFIPPIKPDSGFRVDSLIIYILVPLIVLIKYFKLNFYDKNIKNFMKVMFILPLVLFLSMVHHTPLSQFNLSLDIGPFLGIVRFYLFFVLASIAIKDEKDSRLIFKIAIIGLAFHSLGMIIEYFKIYPFDYILSSFYGNQDYRLGLRGIGNFFRVHTAAFFLCFYFFLLLGLRKYYKNQFTINILLFFSFIAALLPFSKITIILLFFGIFLYIIYIYKLKSAFYLTLVSIFAIGLLFLLPDKAFNYLMYSFDSLKIIFDYLVGNIDAQDSHLTGSVSGREVTLDRVFLILQEAPLLGLGAVESRKFGFIGDSLYFSMVAENGLLGLFTFIGVFSYMAYMMLKKLKVLKIDKPLKFILFMFLLIIFIGGLASSVLSNRTIETLPILFIAVYVFADSRYKTFYRNNICVE
jgi:O-antigen ligase